MRQIPAIERWEMNTIASYWYRYLGLVSGLAMTLFAASAIAQSAKTGNPSTPRTGTPKPGTITPRLPRPDVTTCPTDKQLSVIAFATSDVSIPIPASHLLVYWPYRQGEIARLTLRLFPNTESISESELLKQFQPPTEPGWMILGLEDSERSRLGSPAEYGWELSIQCPGPNRIDDLSIGQILAPLPLDHNLRGGDRGAADNPIFQDLVGRFRKICQPNATDTDRVSLQTTLQAAGAQNWDAPPICRLEEIVSGQ